MVLASLLICFQQIPAGNRELYRSNLQERMPPLLNSHCCRLESLWSIMQSTSSSTVEWMDVLLSKKLLMLDVNNVPIFKSCHVEKRWCKVVPAVDYFPPVKGTISQSELSISQPAVAKSCSYDCNLLCSFLLTSPRHFFPSENTRAAAKNIWPLTAEILQNIPATKKLSNQHVSLHKPAGLQTYRVTLGEKYFILISRSTTLLLHSKYCFEEMTSRGSM